MSVGVCARVDEGVPSDEVPALHRVVQRSLPSAVLCVNACVRECLSVCVGDAVGSSVAALGFWVRMCVNSRERERERQRERGRVVGNTSFGSLCCVYTAPLKKICLAILTTSRNLPLPTIMNWPNTRVHRTKTGRGVFLIPSDRNHGQFRTICLCSESCERDGM